MADPKVDFGFGFNNTAFSDRVLHIEVIKDCLDSHTSKDLPNQNAVQVKTIHICSLVLAASSPFFYKLFQNGMRESQERDVTVRIDASEEEALMNILKFIYSNTLSAATSPDLLGVLLVADKFEVTSCMRYCIREMQKMRMSVESALLYLDLPASVLLNEEVQPLIITAKEFLTALYSDLEYKKEVMDLPLCAVEVVLGSDGLQVNHEDTVFDFILEWGRAHYPDLAERQEILTKRLMRFIRFPYLSSSKLKEAIFCADFDHEQVSKLVLDALFLKVEVPYLKHNHASRDLITTKCSPLGRIYKLRPITVVEIEFSQPRCVVYFDLKKEECESLFGSANRLRSQSFRLGGRRFNLYAECHTNGQHSSFAVFLMMIKELDSCTVDFEFTAIKKSTKEFQFRRKGTESFYTNLDWLWGYDNLFLTPWADFMSKDSEYFIDGILHLRADVTICNSQVQKEEAMDVPLCVVDAFLGSGLKVSSEDGVFDFILDWARARYPKLEERRVILTKRLVRFIRSPYMSSSKLKEAIVCPDFDHEQVFKLLLDALFLKFEVPYLQHNRASKDLKTTKGSPLGRIYEHRPINVVKIKFSQPRCVVYFDLKKEECESFFGSTHRLRSQSFRLGGGRFYLYAECHTNEQYSSFDVFLKMTKESECCKVEVEYAVIEKSTN